jgi:serine/threonine-protein kinase
MNPEPEQRAPPVKRIGRYALHREIAAGGMATVHIGRLSAQAGFSRTVAIKRLHPQFARDPGFVAMFLDEARLAARIQHPNVVSTLDVVAEHDELFLVMEYIQGESVSRVARLVAARGERIPLPIVGAVIVGALNGLHAAHEARDERGAPLDVVHRDVSPQNILIGADGIPRVIDFGVAKAAGRLQETQTGQLKGKLAYMAPEQFREKEITRSVDVYAASIVLWELLTGKRLFAADSQAATIERVLYSEFQPPTGLVPELPPALDAILARGLSRAPEGRFADAREMAGVVEACLGVASMSEVAAWIAAVAGPDLKKRADLVAAIERESEAAPAAIGSVIAIVAAPPPPPSRISTPTLPLFAPKDTDDDAAETSPTIAAPAPEVFVDARSAVAAPEGSPKPGRRRAFVVGGAFVAALVAVAALAASTSAPPPLDVATPAPSVSTSISITTAPENSSSFRAGEVPSAEPAPAPAPAIVASAEIRPAIKRASAPPPAAARPPGARKKTAGSNLPADLPSERN